MKGGSCGKKETYNTWLSIKCHLSGREEILWSFFSPSSSNSFPTVVSARCAVQVCHCLVQHGLCLQHSGVRPCHGVARTLLGQSLLIRPPQGLWDIRSLLCVCGGGFNPKCFKCQRWLGHRCLGRCLCDGHVIGPPGQGRRLQGLLRTLLGLSWERRAEYDDICGRKVCLCCSTIACAQISSGSEMIDLLQKEWTTTQVLQKARETSWGESKDNPSSNLYFNCILGSNSHNKIERWSLHLLWLWTHR